MLGYHVLQNSNVGKNGKTRFNTGNPNLPAFLILHSAFIIWIPRSGLQSTCVALMVFRGVTKRNEVELRMRKHKNGNNVGKDEVTGEMIKGGDDMVLNWIWRLCNKVFQRGVVFEDWRYAVIVPLYTGKGEKSKRRNYGGISLLN